MKSNENLRHSTEEKLKSGLEKYSCIFNYYNKSALVFLSYSITQNGKGFSGINSCFSAVIPFTGADGNFVKTFCQLLHEYTHQFTDGLLKMNINMKDGSHRLSEKVVILADYYLIKAIDENFINKYFNWLGTTESEFFEIYKINDGLETDLKKQVDNIVRGR